MRKPEDALARARRAMSQVDTELDLDRMSSDVLARARSGRDAHPEPDDASVPGVEILRPGQRPALPRRRATAWALVATVALLGGAGAGAALLWPGPGEIVPGAPAPLSPTSDPDLATEAPTNGPSSDPRACPSPPPTPKATTTPDGSDDPSDDPEPPSPCDESPSTDPTVGTDDLAP